MSLFTVNVYLGKFSYEITFLMSLLTQTSINSIFGANCLNWDLIKLKFPSMQVIAITFSYLISQCFLLNLSAWNKSFFRHPILRNCRDTFIAKVYLVKVESNTLRKVFVYFLVSIYLAVYISYWMHNNSTQFLISNLKILNLWF